MARRLWHSRLSHNREGGWALPTRGVMGLLVLALTACDPGLGVDPAWANVPLPDPGWTVRSEMADVGAELYARNCTACHALDGDGIVGPNLRDVTRRRSPEWIRAMIAHPDSMLANDSIAAGLLEEYQIPMVNRRLDDARVRAVVEFLWRADHPPGAAAGGAETSGPTEPSGLP